MSTESSLDHHLPYVVIGHQSAIPHYRVPFYNKLQELADGRWNFGVLFDPGQSGANGSLHDETSINHFRFQVLNAPLRNWKIGPKRLSWQPIKPHIRDASLLVTDTQISNMAYPWTALTRNTKCRWALWGHTSNRNLSAEHDNTLISRSTARIKNHYISKADAFYAYTPAEKAELINRGFPSENVYVVNNTIDLRQQREIFLTQWPDRDSIRKELQLAPDDVVYITVGRMLPGRRIEFLLNAFAEVLKSNPKAKLIVVGSWHMPKPANCNAKGITYAGAIADEFELGRYLTAADAYIVPGMIGLGILQPLAHELPLIGFELETHGPEIDYLNQTNSDLLPSSTTESQLAHYLINQSKSMPARRANIRHESVEHLTIENMATRFDEAIRGTLQL